MDDQSASSTQGTKDSPTEQFQRYAREALKELRYHLPEPIDVVRDRLISGTDGWRIQMPWQWKRLHGVIWDDGFRMQLHWYHRLYAEGRLIPQPDGTVVEIQLRRRLFTTLHIILICAIGVVATGVALDRSWPDQLWFPALLGFMFAFFTMANLVGDGFEEDQFEYAFREIFKCSKGNDMQKHESR